MEKYNTVLKASSLFQGIDEKDFKALLSCLQGTKKEYKKNETVLMVGDPAVKIGMVLAGSVHIVRDDVMGERTILAQCKPGDLFGESFSLGESPLLPVSVLAPEAVTVLLLEGRNIFHTCASSCGFHSTLIDNMVRIMAHKNIYLNQKNEILSSKTTRHKLLTYFSILSAQEGSLTIELPFNRQGLADYLSVDRSALSTALGKMQKEGILSFNKNKVVLNKRSTL